MWCTNIKRYCLFSVITTLSSCFQTAASLSFYCAPSLVCGALRASLMESSRRVANTGWVKSFSVLLNATLSCKNPTPSIQKKTKASRKPKEGPKSRKARILGGIPKDIGKAHAFYFQTTLFHFLSHVKKNTGRNPEGIGHRNAGARPPRPPQENAGIPRGPKTTRRKKQKNWGDHQGRKRQTRWATDWK